MLQSQHISDVQAITQVPLRGASPREIRAWCVPTLGAHWEHEASSEYRTMKVIDNLNALRLSSCLESFLAPENSRRLRARDTNDNSEVAIVSH